jgi:RNA polymerase sigma-70 factor, ECF subfamily
LQCDGGSDTVCEVVTQEGSRAGAGLEELAATYEAHADSVRRTALAVVRDPALAEDVTQDVFLALWSRPERYDPQRGSVESLLRVMARSRALDAARRAGAAQRAQVRLCREADEPERAADPADAVPNELRARRLRRAVRELPDDQRTAITLAYWGEFSAAEVARVYGIPHGTAKSRIRIGLKKLRRDFAD